MSDWAYNRLNSYFSNKSGSSANRAKSEFNSKLNTPLTSGKAKYNFEPNKESTPIPYTTKTNQIKCNSPKFGSGNAKGGYSYVSDTGNRFDTRSNQARGNNENSEFGVNYEADPMTTSVGRGAEVTVNTQVKRHSYLRPGSRETVLPQKPNAGFNSRRDQNLTNTPEHRGTLAPKTQKNLYYGQTSSQRAANNTEINKQAHQPIVYSRPGSKRVITTLQNQKIHEQTSPKSGIVAETLLKQNRNSKRPYEDIHGSIKYEEEERTYQNQELIQNNSQALNSKELLKKANEYIYFINEAYKNCIEKFRKLNEALTKGDKKAINFETMALNFIIDNANAQFTSCHSKFPKEHAKSHTLLLNEMRRDFKSFYSELKKEDPSLSNAKMRFEKVLNLEDLEFYEFKAVNRIDPKSLLDSFYVMQKSLHKTDQMREILGRETSIKMPTINNSYGKAKFG